jgi:hypothetical protein
MTPVLEHRDTRDGQRNERYGAPRAGSLLRRRVAYGMGVGVAGAGWQLFRLVLAMPLQFSPAGHSTCVVQSGRHCLPSPWMFEQMSPDPHSLVLPGVPHPPPPSPPQPTARRITAAHMPRRASATAWRAFMGTLKRIMRGGVDTSGYTATRASGAAVAVVVSGRRVRRRRLTPVRWPALGSHEHGLDRSVL